MSKKQGDYKDYVPFDKCSKKEKRRRNNEQRNTWDFNPATKIEPDKKKKRHSKHKKTDYYDDDYEY